MSLMLSVINSPIPDGRGIDWTQTGIPGGVPERTQIYSTINAVDYGNGTADATEAIQNALDNCPAGQAVLLSPGTFKIQSQIYIPSNVTLRGSGPKETILDIRGSGRGAVIIGNTGLWIPPEKSITGGYERGSDTITLASTEGISEGQYLLITQNNPDYVDINGFGGECTWSDEGWNGTRAMGQIVEVTSVDGLNVGITPPLYITYEADLTPVACPFTAAAKYAGLEDLQLYANNTGYGANVLMGCAGTLSVVISGNTVALRQKQRSTHQFKKYC